MSTGCGLDRLSSAPLSGPVNKAALLVLVLFVFVACGPRVQSFGPTVGPPQLADDHFLTGDGKTLTLQKWRAEGELEAVIVAVHGFQMYSGHFQNAGPWWAKRGITTIAYDQRGHGGSPERGIWGGVEALTSDLAEMVRAVAKRYPDVPVYILGASMGGAVTLATVTDLSLPINGVILTAPAVWGGDALHPLARGSVWLAAYVMPWNHASASDIRRQASDNIDMLRANGRDKMNVFGTRFDTLYGLTQMMAAGFDASDQPLPPILALYGKKDEIIPAAPVFRTVDRLPDGTRFVLYPEGWHMLLRDLQAEIVWRDVATWVKDRNADLPSGQEVVDKKAAWASLTD